MLLSNFWIPAAKKFRLPALRISNTGVAQEDGAGGKSAKERIVTAEEIIARTPDIIIGSWCGKKFRAEKVTARPGFAQLPAVRNGALHEIKSSLILQPGPAALTDGLRALQDAIQPYIGHERPLLPSSQVAH